jgi:hypothetical protein
MKSIPLINGNEVSAISSERKRRDKWKPGQRAYAKTSVARRARRQGKREAWANA